MHFFISPAYCVPPTKSEKVEADQYKLEAVGPKIVLMHGFVPQTCGARRIVSSSLAPVDGELTPPCDGSRQSPCPANLVAFTAVIQSQAVVSAPCPNGSTLHVPLAHVPHPSVPPSECTKQLAAAAKLGWHQLVKVLQSPLQHPAHE